ncbi:MAG: nucleotidyltransferase substrate binding protein [Prochlorococcaceae cyanobacterium]|jgi:hypothetical protein
MSWNTLRDLLRNQGDATLLGSRDTLRESFRLELIENGEAWMLMIQDRNLTSLTYNRSTAERNGHEHQRCGCSVRGRWGAINRVPIWISAWRPRCSAIPLASA